MTQPLTTGEKNRRANIRSLKVDGRANAKAKAAQRAANIAEHQARMEGRRILAIIDRRERQAAGIAKRDAHNEALHADKVRDLAGQLVEMAQREATFANDLPNQSAAKAIRKVATRRYKFAASIMNTIGEQLPLAA